MMLVDHLRSDLFALGLKTGDSTPQNPVIYESLTMCHRTLNHVTKDVLRLEKKPFWRYPSSGQPGQHLR